MSKRSLCLLPLLVVMTGVLVLGAAASDPPRDDYGTRLATYDRAAGESYFAWSVTPQTRPTPAEAHDVVILVDTSASQRGPFREDSLLAVTTIVSELDRQDRVSLFAVDLAPVALGSPWMEAGGPELQAALADLRQRAPLGATDMIAALRGAIGALEGPPENPRAVVYIGDGVSRAKALRADELRSIVDQCVAQRIAVSSFAIGPQRNVAFLAMLANQTGGVIVLDTDEGTAAQTAGVQLARAVQQTVFWPQEVQFSPGIVEFYPRAFPPLRTDRDTVVIGKLEGQGPQSLKMMAEAHGTRLEMVWNTVAERSREDFAFLPLLVDMARDDGGLMLPTVGSAGLREVARVIFADSQDLSLIGRLPHVAQKTRDTNNPVFHLARYQDSPQDDPLILQGDDLESELDPAARLLDQVQADRRVLAGKIQAEIEQGLSQTRRQMATSPDIAIQSLKVMLNNLDRAPDLDPEIRAQLRDRVVTAMREASRRQVEADELLRQALANQAIAEEAQRLVTEFTDKRLRVKLLMDKFNALVDEGITLALSGENVEAEENLDAASHDIANTVEAQLPFDTIGISARFNASFIRQMTGSEKFRQMRHQNFVNALYEVERAAIPFPGDPPIQYPDPEWWEEMSVRRIDKYRRFDLLGRGSKEEAIYKALDQEIMLQFDETPLSAVIEEISRTRDIPIVINRRALEDLGMGTEEPVTISLPGVSLRSGLKIMLGELDLTYIIRNEVMTITTPEDAEGHLLTRVYPVADLVLPIISGMGMGMGMGGGMGGMGGGMGGMGGGMGGMGGGMGGMGGFGGGMGGMFRVEEDLTLGDKPSPEEPVSDQPASTPALGAAEPSDSDGESEVLTVSVREGETLDDAWDRFFTETGTASGERSGELDGRIRATARRLSDRREFPEIESMLTAAMRHGRGESWMFEALGLAMLAAGRADAEVERVLTSAIDLSGAPDDLMDVAIYLAQVGLDRRALHLFREVAYDNPFRPEPYALGLASAMRLEDLEGIQWATLGVVRQAWPHEQQVVEDRALRVATATVERLRELGRHEEADQYAEALEEARLRDVRVKVSWTGDADIDLVVEEPAGTICSLHTPRTVAGGVLLGDAYSTGKPSEGYSETYVCPQGFSGQYRVLINRVWGQVTAGKVTVDIHTTNPDRPHIRAQIPLGEKDAVVMFDLAQGRRSDLLAQQQVANMRSPRVDADRSMLTRQLSRYEDSLAHRDFNRARAGQRGWRGGGPVGFQPDITVLPSGAMLQGAGSLAVVDAERRYVRVSPMPFFSQIGEVTTFNFGGGGGGDLPDDDDDDDDDGGGNQ